MSSVRVPAAKPAGSSRMIARIRTLLASTWQPTARTTVRPTPSSSWSVVIGGVLPGWFLSQRVESATSDREEPDADDPDAHELNSEEPDRVRSTGEGARGRGVVGPSDDL